MGPILLIIIGAAAGLIATRVMKVEANLFVTIGIGVLGAIVGGLLLRALLSMMGWMSGFVGAVLGAMALIWIYQRYFSGR